jgi:hypothetical protein
MVCVEFLARNPAFCMLSCSPAMMNCELTRIIVGGIYSVLCAFIRANLWQFVADFLLSYQIGLQLCLREARSLPLPALYPE